MLADDKDLLDEEYEDEDSEYEEESEEEDSKPKKKGKSKKSLDTKNKFRQTIEINDELVIETLNLIKNHPENYNADQRFNFNTKSSILNEAIKIGLRCIVENNATLDSLIEDSLKRRMRCVTQMIADDFAKFHRDITQLKLNQIKQNLLMKSLIKHEIDADAPMEILNYRLEDLNNLSNENIESFISSLQEDLLTKEEIEQEESLEKNIKLINK